MTIVSASSSSTATTGSEDAGGPASQSSSNDGIVQLAGLYDPNLLCDYGGWIFQHEQARLAQHPVYDAIGALIPPWELYGKLRPGTLVLVQATLMVWHTNEKWDRRVYQILADKIKVLDESDEPIEERAIPTYPPNGFGTPSTSGKKQGHSDEDDTLDASPMKKHRVSCKSAGKEIAGQAMDVDKASK